MKKNLFRSLLWMLLVGSTFVFAQTKPESFVVGETLTYEGKLSKSIIRGIVVAEMTFSVSRAPDGSDFLIKTEASSKGTLTKLFRQSFLQRYESVVDDKDLNILRTVKHDEQNDRVRDSTAEFDYKKRKVTYTETDPNNLMRPPRKIASSIEPDTQDLVSGVYQLRRLPLGLDKNFVVNISDSGLMYKIPVRVTGRERLDTSLGKVFCFRVEPEVFGENNLLRQKGNMIIWITDDARRLPVRAQINVGFGRIEIKLRKLENKK